jgi:hypothetical protein
LDVNAFQTQPGHSISVDCKRLLVQEGKGHKVTISRMNLLQPGKNYVVVGQIPFNQIPSQLYTVAPNSVDDPDP